MNQDTRINANRRLLAALNLIKNHIGPENTRQNAELHCAVQNLVSGARMVGLLEHGCEFEVERASREIEGGAQ